MRSIPILGRSRTLLALFLIAFPSFTLKQTSAQSPTVRQRESAYHGFLILRTQAGVTIGSGEVIQQPAQGHMSVRLVFRFKDGSLDDETTEYSQDRTFHLLSDRHIQRGPFFPHPIDTTIDVAAQQVKITQLDKGPASTSVEHIDMPQDLSNGIVLTLIKNLQSDGGETKISYLAFSPKGRVVQLAISNAGQQSFRIAGHSFKATHYRIKINLGGITGVVAPLIGKEPSDIDVWATVGKVPAIVRVDGALYLGGPILEMLPATPAW